MRIFAHKRAEMSDIYEDVERTNRKQFEMRVAIYECEDFVRDKDFQSETNTQQPLQNTGNDSIKARIPIVAVVCLVLLYFVLLAAVIYIYTNNTNCSQDISVAKLTEERDRLLTKIKAWEDCKNQTQTIEKKDVANDDQIKQTEGLQQEETDLQKRFHDLDGWFYYQSSFYFLSSEKKTWNESRGYCRDRGADLIVINNKQEQDFFMKMSGTSFWIGMTDHDEEGIWKWIDGTKENTGFRNWRSREPNGDKAENCALSYSSGWADYPCHANFKWICKKSTFKCHMYML